MFFFTCFLLLLFYRHFSSLVKLLNFPRPKPIHLITADTSWKKIYVLCLPLVTQRNMSCEKVFTVFLRRGCHLSCRNKRRDVVVVFFCFFDVISLCSNIFPRIHFLLHYGEARCLPAPAVAIWGVLWESNGVCFVSWWIISQLLLLLLL